MKVEHFKVVFKEKKMFVKLNAVSEFRFQTTLDFGL